MNVLKLIGNGNENRTRSGKGDRVSDRPSPNGKASIDSDRVSVCQPILVKNGLDISKRIVSYVAIDRETIALNDVSNEHNLPKTYLARKLHLQAKHDGSLFAKHRAKCGQKFSFFQVQALGFEFGNVPQFDRNIAIGIAILNGK